MSLSSFQSNSGHRHSTAASNSSNPFRSQSRENLPSFDDCFAGFNDRLRLSQLGERHITAPSPQQWQPQGGGHLSTTPSAKRAGLFGSTDLRAGVGQQPPQSVGRTGGAYTSSPSVLFGAQLPSFNVAATGIAAADDRDPADFSYRTLPVSDQGSSDDDDAGIAGTPPRPIERSPGHPSSNSTPLISHRGDNHATPGRGGLDTPLNKKPPLHPNVSPIFSPSRSAAAPQANRFEGEDHLRSEYYLGHEDPLAGRGKRTQRNEDGQHDGGGSAHPSIPTAGRSASTGAARPVASLDEAVVSQLFPLFSQFLRSLPPQQLERLLVVGDDGLAAAALDPLSTRSVGTYRHACLYFSGSELSGGTPAELAEAIIPSTELISVDCGARLGDREFSYYRPHSRTTSVARHTSRLASHSRWNDLSRSSVAISSAW